LGPNSLCNPGDPSKGKKPDTRSLNKWKDGNYLYADIDKRKVKEVRDIWPFFRDRRIDTYSDLLKRFCD